MRIVTSCWISLEPTPPPDEVLMNKKNEQKGYSSIIIN